MFDMEGKRANESVLEGKTNSKRRKTKNENAVALIPQKLCINNDMITALSEAKSDKELEKIIVQFSSLDFS